MPAHFDLKIAISTRITCYHELVMRAHIVDRDGVQWIGTPSPMIQSMVSDVLCAAMVPLAYQVGLSRDSWPDMRYDVCGTPEVRIPCADEMQVGRLRKLFQERHVTQAVGRALHELGAVLTPS